MSKHKINFKASNGYKATAFVHMLPHCCAIAVVHNVMFVVKNSKGKYEYLYIIEECEEVTPYLKGLKILYREFNEFLKTAKKPFDINRSKILMADELGGEITEFIGSVKGWKKGPISINRKSSNMVRTYELQRKVYEKKYSFDSQGNQTWKWETESEAS